MKVVDLPSGAKLSISRAPFEDAKNLYQTICDELKALDIDASADIMKDMNLWKGLACTFLASKKIEAVLTVCLRRSLYNGEKITADTWTDDKTWQDYMPACYEVMLENVSPFLKSLSAKFDQILGELKNSRA